MLFININETIMLKYVIIILTTKLLLKDFFFFFLSSIRMSGKNIIFDHKKTNMSNFYKNRKVFKIYDIEVDKTLISKKEPYGKKSLFKYFLGYNDDDDDDVMRPLCIKLPQMIGYVKHFHSYKTMSFKVNNNRLLKKYTKIWGKVNILMNIEFDSEPVYDDNDKYIKAKLKSYGDKVNTNFQGKRRKYQKKIHHISVCH